LNPLSPDLRDALHARLRFYRELGIGELYSREVDSSLWAEPEPQAASLPAASSKTPTHSQDSPKPAAAPALFPQIAEENAIAPRKPFPAAPALAEPLPPEQHFAALKLIREEIGDCTRCALAKGRNKLVFGDGDPNAKLMFMGEGPGALGQTAVTYLTGEKRPLSGWRGTTHPFRGGAKLIVTYHPAFLLRDPNQKKHAWADLQIAMRELGLEPPARK